MGDSRFKLTVTGGVEFQPMEQLDAYELARRVEVLREWFGLVPEQFAIEAQAATPTEEN
jgi:hypothetical protein